MREQVTRWTDRVAEPGRSGMSLEPATAFEAVTRQMVDDLAREIGEIKGRLNGLLFMVAGAIVIDVALRLAGA